MKENNSNIFLEDQKNDFCLKKSKSNLNISFNRVSFIFLFFLLYR